jgi:hypothetical protein
MAGVEAGTCTIVFAALRRPLQSGVASLVLTLAREAIALAVRLGW